MELQLVAIADADQQAALLPAWRYVVFHKQKTSARTRFLIQGRDVVFPVGLDDGQSLTDAEDPEAVEGRVLPHPAAGLKDLAAQLDLPPSAFRVDAAHLGRVVEEDLAPVWLVEVTTIDPPLENALRMGGRFISIMEARQSPAVQRELLRRAYERVLG
jgi:hypothetical protein